MPDNENRDIESTLEALGGLVDVTDLKAAMVEAPVVVENTKVDTIQTEQKTVEKDVLFGNDNKEVAPVVEPVTNAPVVETPTNTDVYVDSPIYGGKKRVGGEGKPKDEPTTFESFEQVDSYVKDSFGIDGGLDKYFEVSKKWRKDSQDLSDASTKATGYEELFGALPEELRVGISAYANGQDWREAVSTKRVDFTKDVKDVPQKELIEYYYPGEFSQEDFEDIDDNRSLKVAIKGAEKQFYSDKQTFDMKRAQIYQQQESRQKNLLGSIGGSVEYLKESLPDVNSSTLSKVEQRLKSGDINSLIYNQDGTYKKEAALALVMMEHGYDAIRQLEKIYENRAQTKVTEDILSRGSDKPSNKKQGSTSTGDNKMILDRIDELMGGLNPKRTF